MIVLGKYAILAVFLATFLLSFTPVALAHDGQDHPEETHATSHSSKMKIAEPTAAVLSEHVETTQLWIPVMAVIAGILVGSFGIFFLHTRVLHPKDN